MDNSQYVSVSFRLICVAVIIQLKNFYLNIYFQNTIEILKLIVFVSCVVSLWSVASLF